MVRRESRQNRAGRLVTEFPGRRGVEVLQGSAVVAGAGGHHDAAARFQHPAQLQQRSADVGDVIQHVVRHRAVARAAGERQRFEPGAAGVNRLYPDLRRIRGRQRGPFRASSRERRRERPAAGETDDRCRVRTPRREPDRRSPPPGAVTPSAGSRRRACPSDGRGSPGECGACRADSIGMRDSRSRCRARSTVEPSPDRPRYGMSAGRSRLRG